MVEKGVKVSELVDESTGVMPLSYCYCCAAASRRHIELKLGVLMKTKEIVSLPINSKGESPCRFIFEAV